MNYSKQYITEFSLKTGFIASNIEKVIRLLDVLGFIFNESSFRDALSLKGGTAINLIHSDLKRLSVDIDLDYHRSLDKDETAKDRTLILQELDGYMEKEGYSISDKSRGSTILASRTYSYLNAFGNNDNIKVEINFIDRISLYPTVISNVIYFDKKISVVSLVKEELYGMKLAALIDRSKPRDLYDADYLFNNLEGMDLTALRKAVVFYLSLDGVFKIDETTFKGINAISGSAIKKELLPVLKKGEWFDLSKTKESVVKNLSGLLSLERNESLYLEEFSKGNYDSNLLFEKPIAERAEKHPMAKWRISKIKNK